MRKKKPSYLALFLALILLPLSAFADMTVTFIDVGQGDAAFVQADGKNMLIDAGPNSNVNDLLSFLSASGISKIDILVGTHPHEDHIGGMDEVLAKYDIGAIWMPKVAAETKAFENLLLAIKNKGLKVTAPELGTSYKLGNANITIMAPFVKAYDELNDYSVVFRFEYGKTSFLFTGDAESPVENEILNHNFYIDSDVLKVAHHGSTSSTSQSFLDAVSPLWAIISCGQDNIYGHPHEETLEMLNGSGATVLRTDLDGTITLISDGRSIERKDDSTYARTNTDNVNVRSNPSAKGKKVTTLKEGVMVTITGSSTVAGETWYLVDTGTKTGYTRSDLLTVLSANEAALVLSSTPTPKPASFVTKYIGNKNTKVFHLTTCHTLPSEKNQVYFDSRDYAIAKGYRPCKNCDP